METSIYMHLRQKNTFHITRISKLKLVLIKSANLKYVFLVIPFKKLCLKPCDKKSVLLNTEMS